MSKATAPVKIQKRHSAHSGKCLKRRTLAMYIDPWQERRKNFRLKDYLPIHYELKAQSRYGNAITQDISESGTRILLDNFIPRFSKIALQINLNPGKQFQVNGEVKWAERTSHSYRYQTGVEFKNLNLESKRNLAKFIAENKF